MTGTKTPPAGAEPVAIIGVGCRFPAGINSPAHFWEFLVDGGDAITDIPDERWQFYQGLGPDYAATLRQANRRGAFLPDIAGFDAEFFGLTPREAELMDPQQRLLLEVAWEALEQAGVPPDSLAGSDTAVFASVDSGDYGRRLLEDLPGIEAWTGIGAAGCAAANRISYALDLRGPSVSVDTACSGSLVTVHLACQSLRAGESSVALAAGVNVLLSPGLTLALDASGALAPDGRCKTFDASADGYGRGEGCAVLVLKTLSEAQRDGDQVLAVILGSAVRQDGRTRGIMAPNGAAQEQVIRAACRSAGLSPGLVDYVETHGTGTVLGDQTEAEALARVYGAAREPGRPCLIGSVKPNIGHLEAAAGAASLIKVVLAIGNAEIPPSLNFGTANPAVHWAESGLRVVSERTAWPQRERRRRAGVSSFGFGGTIAHVVIEQAPSQPAPARPASAAPRGGADSPASPRLFPLSARSAAALRQYAGSLSDWCTGSAADVPLASVAHSLSLRRSHLEHRGAVVAASREDLAAGLRLLAAGDQSRQVITGSVPQQRGAGLVWVFSGHGSQWAGMGRELLASEPSFARVIDMLGPIFDAEIGFTPRQVLANGDLDEIARIQSVTFAVQAGLTEVWRHYGVTPDAVIGHSLGEFAAAVAAGCLDLPDAARIVCRRSRLLRRVAGRGAMAMASLPFDDAVERLSGRPGLAAAIAAAPESTVISGDCAAVEALIEEWQALDIAMRRVASDVAFHGPHMDELLPDMIAAAAGLSPRQPGIAMYSTCQEGADPAPTTDGRYWADNLRNPVRLVGAVTAAARDGYRDFLEISAHPIVTHSIRETLGQDDAGVGGDDDVFVGETLRRNLPEQVALLASAAALHCRGIAVNWARLQPGGGLVPLPLVPWQRRRNWRDPSPRMAEGNVAHDVDTHTLLGPELSVAGSSLRVWRTRLDDSCLPYPGSHTIGGIEIVPAAVLISTFLRAAARTGPLPVLSDLALRAALTAAPAREIQVVLDGATVRLASRAPGDEPGQDGAWLTHATAVARPRETAARLPGALADAARLGAERTEAGLIRDRLAAVGIPTMAFSWTVQDVLRGPGILRAQVRVEQPRHAPPTWAPVLDAALSAVQAVFAGPPALRIVGRIDEIVLTGDLPATVLIEVAADRSDKDAANVLIASADGHVLARLAGVHCPVMGEDAAAPVSARELVHEMAWRPLDLPAPPAQRDDPARSVVLVAPARRPAEQLRDRLCAARVDCRVISRPQELDGLRLSAATSVLVLPPPAQDSASVPEAAEQSAWLLASTAQRLAGRGAPFPRLWCLTSGVREGRREDQLSQAALWGLGRVISDEHPELCAGVLDLAPDEPFSRIDNLLRVLWDAPRDDVIALRGQDLSVARLTRTTRPAARGPLRCAPDGTYLITGGLGELGLQVAHWLAGRGARRIVLVSRRPFPARARWDSEPGSAARQRIKRIRALETLGVTVRVVSLDIADADQAARHLTPDALGLPPIRGVVHAAGVLDNRMAMHLDAESLRTVMRPKVAGAWVLHELFPPGSLDFLVLFSSAGHLMRMPGQASYGAANAFLDGMAAFRNAAGAPDTTSFGWASWRGNGMAANEIVEIEQRARGMSDITADDAFSAWNFAAERGVGYFPVLGLLPLEPGMQTLPLFSELTAADARTAPAVAPAADTDPLAGLPADELRERTLELVGRQIAAEMKLQVSELNPQRSLIEQGLDSVMTVIIRRGLERRFGHKLPATLLWQRPTVTAIAEHLVQLVSAPAAPGDAKPADSSPVGSNP
jgi:6-methylsalicylic acid synthase